MRQLRLKLPMHDSLCTSWNVAFGHPIARCGNEIRQKLKSNQQGMAIWTDGQKAAVSTVATIAFNPPACVQLRREYACDTILWTIKLPSDALRALAPQGDRLMLTGPYVAACTG